MSVEVKVTFIRARHYWDRRPSGFTLIGTAVTDDGELIGVKGPVEFEGELVDGLTYRMFGKWGQYTNKHSGKTEKQIHFQSFVVSRPVGKEPIIAYLKSHGKGLGIGEVKARQLWELWGEDAVTRAREQPESVAGALDRVPLEKAELFADRLREGEDHEQSMMEVMGLLDRRGFPKDLPKKILKKWGNRAMELLARNPYLLMSFRGCGFLLCDRMYIDLGLNPNRLKRQALSIWYVCSHDTSGSTWLPLDKVLPIAAKRLVDGKFEPELALRLALRAGLVVVTSVDQGNISGTGKRWITDARKGQAEWLAATRVSNALDGESAPWPNLEQQDLSPHQFEALMKCAKGPIGVLGGSPGTGKTYAAARLIRSLSEMHAGSIAVAAPTGKAAVRISETLQQYGISIRAKTWHSLLGVGEHDDESGLWSFDHNESNPWDFSYIIGDESSMIDTSLFSSIMAARGTAKILFVGDVNQLPPVGHGAPLRDLINTGVPYGELREIIRNSGGIVEACAAIRDGEDWQPGDNLILVDQVVGSEKLQVEEIRKELETQRAAGKDWIWECQVLVPLNKRTEISRKKLNPVLAELLNPTPLRTPSQPFAVGDKIVNGKNSLFPVDPKMERKVSREAAVDSKGNIFVANGELAKVTEVFPNRFTAALTSPERYILVPRGQAREKTDEEGDDDTGTGCSWELGYALSVHKSQGSEWPVAIVAVDESRGAGLVCSREWIYTAISRAKERCVIVGRKHVADRYCKRVAIDERRTLLTQTIQVELAWRKMADL